MRTLNFSILFVYLNFNKLPSSDFRVHWNARNSEKRTRKFRLPSILEHGISKTISKAQESTVTVCCGYVTPKQKCLQLPLKLSVANVLSQKHVVTRDGQHTASFTHPAPLQHCYTNPQWDRKYIVASAEVKSQHSWQHRQSFSQVS